VTPPSPIFISNIKTGPHSPKGHGHTPPRSPSAEKYNLGKTFSPKISGSLLFDSAPMGSPSKNNNQGLHSSNEDLAFSNSQ
jgi:hypothetical protein